LTEDSALEIWKQAVELFDDTLKQSASTCTSVAILAPNRLAVHYAAEYTFDKERCERPECLQRIESALTKVAGRPLKVAFEILPGEAPKRRPQQMSKRQKLHEVQKDPLVKEAIELFDGEPIDVISPNEKKI